MLSYTQKELAEKAGIGLSTLRRLEYGNKTVRPQSWNKVMDALTQAGIEFLPATKGRSTGIRLVRTDVERRPSIFTMRAARLMLGFGQDDLAGKANVGRQTMLRLERGDTSISLQIWDKVFDALVVAGIEFLPPTTHRSWGIRLRTDEGDEG